MEISVKYYRKLAHSLAKRFFMDSKTQKMYKTKKGHYNYNQEPEEWKILFWKTKKAKIPILKLSDLIDKNMRHRDKDNNHYNSHSYEGNITNTKLNINKNNNNYLSDLNIK